MGVFKNHIWIQLIGFTGHSTELAAQPPHGEGEGRKRLVEAPWNICMWKDPVATFSYQHPLPPFSLSVSRPFSAVHTPPNTRRTKERVRCKERLQDHHCGYILQFLWLFISLFSTNQRVIQLALWMRQGRIFGFPHPLWIPVGLAQSPGQTMKADRTGPL